ncbi:FBP domain-containing protein [Mycetocola miduiensis]|uniref:FBP C-terminal treble-clef zinc-finger n=1 Tax=Mycetocola miduiensis TaxID=995034 RepID=A0A1I5CZW5_9MICO|nr:FBP domain-containing protein [Mycetocola miduiensis]SFN92545.1 FBP C-terminal treble-clef zinc-finger [Mycetocola miduiensis]
MQELTEGQIRSSFVNCGTADATRMFVPSGLAFAPWAELDYFGWGDPNTPGRYSLVYWREDSPAGIVLRRADRVASRIQVHLCSFCHTPQPANDVALFVAPLAGEAGQNGSTVGTYICSELTCSAHVRLQPHAAPIQPYPSTVMRAYRARLLERVDRFVADIERVR